MKTRVKREKHQDMKKEHLDKKGNRFQGHFSVSNATKLYMHSVSKIFSRTVGL